MVLVLGQGGIVDVLAALLEPEHFREMASNFLRRKTSRDAALLVENKCLFLSVQLHSDAGNAVAIRIHGVSIALEGFQSGRPFRPADSAPGRAAMLQSATSAIYLSVCSGAAKNFPFSAAPSGNAGQCSKQIPHSGQGGREHFVSVPSDAAAKLLPPVFCPLFLVVSRHNAVDSRAILSSQQH